MTAELKNRNEGPAAPPPARRRMLATALSLVFALGLTSCATINTEFSSWVVSYNREVEKIQNQTLLMNVLRAGHDLPVVFTSIQVVRGSGNTGMAATVGGSGTAQTTKAAGMKTDATIWAIAPSASLTVSSGFQFDVVVLDSAEFYQGLLTPIGIDALHALSKRGIPAELILYLMVDRITLTVNGVAETYVNDPADPNYARFQSALGNLLKMGLTTELQSSGAPVGPLLTEADLKSNLPSMFTAATAGLVPMPEPGGYRFVKRTASARLCFMGGGAATPDLPQGSLCAASPKKKPTTAHALPVTEGANTLALPQAAMAVQTRSTRDVYGYLGRLLRAQTEGRPEVTLESPEATAYQSASRGRALFKVLKDSPRPDDLYAVEYRGTTYSLPREDQGYTATVLAVMQQFFSLSKSVNSAPPTGSVVVN